MRLFVALDLPDAVRATLTALMIKLKPECRAARWVRPEALHITLKFLGEIDPQHLDAIRAALSPIHSAQPIAIDFRVLGFFPNEFMPRVIWCGVQATANLAEIAAAVDRALEPFAIKQEHRDFVPHLTLARLDPAADLENLVRAASALQSFDFGSAVESEFHLIESILQPIGAKYKKVATFPFVRGSQ